MTDNWIKRVWTCTNMQEWVVTDGWKEWKNVTKHELMAFIGLTILAGSEKNWEVPVCVFFGSPLDNPLNKATILTQRYSLFLALWWQVDQSLPTENRPHGSFLQHLFLIKWRQKFIPKFIVLWHEQASERLICRTNGQWVLSMQQESKSFHVILNILGARLYHRGLNNKLAKMAKKPRLLK